MTAGAELTLDLSEAFRSRTGGGLSYAATSTDEAVAGASVDGALLTVRAGTPVEGRSLARTTRTDFRWSGLEPGAYALRVRSADAGGAAGPWSEPSNAVDVH